MAALQLCLIVLLLLATTLGQETDVVTLPGNIRNVNETSNITKEEADIKPPAEEETVLVIPLEIDTSQGGNVSVEIKDIIEAKPPPEQDTPVEKEDFEIAVRTSNLNRKADVGNKNPLITKPDAIKDLGGRCSKNEDCSSVNNTHCVDKMCVCIHGFIPSKHSLDKCVKVPNSLDDACEEEVQCSHIIPASECRNGKCLCPPNFIFTLNRCWEKQMLGGACNITEQCKDVALATCTQGVCDCQPLFIASPNNKCLEIVGKEYKAACEEDIQCSLSYGDEARCSHGQCRCTNNYHYNGTKCIIDKKLGDTCSSNAQCEVTETNNEEASRVCLDNLCTCAKGYSSLSGEDLCSKSSGNKMAVSLSWILCCILAKLLP